MPVFNVYKDLIVPIGEWLQATPQLQGIKIFYDRTEDRTPHVSLLPAINYFWMSPVEDIARGSGSASLQLRRQSLTIGFGVWATHHDPSELDNIIWEMAQVLGDLLRSRTNFNPTLGITLKDTMAMDISRYGDSPMAAGILVTAEFEMFGGSFHGGPSL